MLVSVYVSAALCLSLICCPSGRGMSPRARDRDRKRDQYRDKDPDRRDRRRSHCDSDEDDRRRSRPTRSHTPDSDYDRSKRRRGCGQCACGRRRGRDQTGLHILRREKQIVELPVVMTCAILRGSLHNNMMSTSRTESKLYSSIERGTRG